MKLNSTEINRILELKSFPTFAKYLYGLFVNYHTQTEHYDYGYEFKQKAIDNSKFFINYPFTKESLRIGIESYEGMNKNFGFDKWFFAFIQVGLIAPVHNPTYKGKAKMNILKEIRDDWVLHLRDPKTKKDIVIPGKNTRSPYNLYFTPRTHELIKYIHEQYHKPLKELAKNRSQQLRITRFFERVYGDTILLTLNGIEAGQYAVNNHDDQGDVEINIYHLNLQEHQKTIVMLDYLEYFIYHIENMGEKYQIQTQQLISAIRSAEDVLNAKDFSKLINIPDN